MQFSVRVSDYQKNQMLNICDPNLVGKKLNQKNLQLHISKSYYGEKLVEKKGAEILLKNSSIINMVGEETISLSMSIGIGSEKGIK